MSDNSESRRETFKKILEDGIENHGLNSLESFGITSRKQLLKLIKLAYSKGFSDGYNSASEFYEESDGDVGC